MASFVRDHSGVAAVEFALIAPLLIAFYLGFTELCAGFMAQKRVSHVSSLVADLVAQGQVMSADDIDDMFAIGNVIMKPFPAADLEQRVRSITLVDGVAQVNWSHETSDVFPDGPVNLPDGLLEEDQSLVMSEALYDFHSPIGNLLPIGTKLRAQYYLRPRVVDQVVCSDCGSP